LLKNLILGRLFKNVQMQGAQKLRKEAYIDVCRLTRLAAQRSRWAFFNSLLVAFLIQDLPHFSSQIVCSNRFLDEIHTLIQNAVMGDDIGRVP
jgi:hypothetical protein